MLIIKNNLVFVLFKLKSMVFVAIIVIAIVVNDDDTMADFRALFLLKNPPEHI